VRQFISIPSWTIVLTKHFIDITATLTYDVYAPRKDLTVDGFQEVNDIALVPIPAEKPPCATRTICLEFNFAVMTDQTRRAICNGITYNFPLVPTVFSELTLGMNATNPNAYGPLSFVLNHGEVIDLVVKSSVAGHPL
jgi:iron transport multicopper oxidase